MVAYNDILPCYIMESNIKQDETTRTKRKGAKSMNATRKLESTAEKRTVDTAGLHAMLSSGRKTAVEIGIAAGARIQVGRRVLWNVNKVQEYLDCISE